MQALTIVASVASVVSAIVSIFTFLIVARRRTAIKRHSRHKHLAEIIDRVLRVPPTKDTLPDSTGAEIRFIIDTARSHDFSFWFFLDRSAKRIARIFENELIRNKSRQILQNNLVLVHEVRNAVDSGCEFSSSADIVVVIVENNGRCAGGFQRWKLYRRARGGRSQM